MVSREPETNEKNVFVWNHYFDFEYRDTLISPWYAGLAQGMAISLLSRAYKLSEDEKYFSCIKKVMISMTKQLKKEVLFLLMMKTTIGLKNILSIHQPIS